MKKYTVMVEGKNFLYRNLDDNRDERKGFFATRRVEADNPEEAEKIALDLIREEFRPLNKSDDPPILYIKKINEVSSFGDNITPGKGASWYPEEAE